MIDPLLASAGIGRWRWSAAEQRFSGDGAAGTLLQLGAGPWGADAFWGAFGASGTDGAEQFRAFLAATGAADFAWEGRVDSGSDRCWLRVHGTRAGVDVEGIVLASSSRAEQRA